MFSHFNPIEMLVRCKLILDADFSSVKEGAENRSRPKCNGPKVTKQQAEKYCFTYLFMVEFVPPASLLGESEAAYCTGYTRA